jgi:hypothetical protein
LMLNPMMMTHPSDNAEDRRGGHGGHAGRPWRARAIERLAPRAARA